MTKKTTSEITDIATREEQEQRLFKILEAYPHYIYFEKEPSINFITRQGYKPMKLHVIFRSPKGGIAFLSDDFTKQYMDMVSDDDLSMLLDYIKQRYYVAEKATLMEHLADKINEKK